MNTGKTIGQDRKHRSEYEMNYQKQEHPPGKPVGGPMFSSTWLALFTLLRASLQQNPSI